MSEIDKGKSALGITARVAQEAQEATVVGEQIKQAIDLPALRLQEEILRETEKKKTYNKHDVLRGLSVNDLLHLRQEIDNLLPALKLTDMNLEEELVIQYQLAKNLQTSVLDNSSKGTPDKEKSQLLKNATSTLQALISLQGSVYTHERLKLVESCMKRAFEGVSLEIRTKFFESYEKLLKDSLK